MQFFQSLLVILAIVLLICVTIIISSKKGVEQTTKISIPLRLLVCISILFLIAPFFLEFIIQIIHQIKAEKVSSEKKGSLYNDIFVKCWNLYKRNMHIEISCIKSLILFFKDAFYNILS